MASINFSNWFSFCVVRTSMFGCFCSILGVGALGIFSIEVRCLV